MMKTNIPIKLGKQLKEAGFIHTTHWLNTVGGSENPEMLEDLHMVPDPTLSELIEACGDNLIAIQNRHLLNGFDEQFTTKWCAVKEWEAYYPPEVSVGYYGSTPEEAVANLWLTLHV